MVNNPTQKDVPAFYSPLTHDQHAQLGRIAVLWGQIDMFMDSLLTYVVGISPELRKRLLSDRPTGAKLDLLRDFLKDRPDGEPKKSISKFVKMAVGAKATRNQCFHGTWGYRILRKKKKVIAAAQHHKQPEQPFKVDDLPKLERKLCQISHQGMLAISAVNGEDPPLGAQPLFHGDVSFEEWFSEWRTRHYEDRHTPGRNWKPGRLPYLEHPLE